MNFVMTFASRNKLFLVYIILITVMSSQTQFGFLMVLAVPVTVIIQLIRLFICRKDPILRKDRYIAIGMIALSLFVVSLSHTFKHKAARNVANKFVAEIALYQKTNGRYPLNGNELGLSDNLRERPYRLTYYNKEGNPHLYYVATFGPFDMYSYNFSDGVWDYQPD